MPRLHFGRRNRLCFARFGAALLGLLAMPAWAEERLTETGTLVQKEPVPPWVREREATAEATPEPDLGAYGRYELLRDLQIKEVSEAGSLRRFEYMHRTDRLTTTSAVDELARFHFTVDPSTRIHLYRARVKRDGSFVDLVVRSRRYAAEKNADSAIYDGRVAIDFLLADLRVNDELDIAYAVDENAAFDVAGKYDLRGYAATKDAYFTYYPQKKDDAVTDGSRFAGLYRREPNEVFYHGITTALTVVPETPFVIEFHDGAQLPFEDSSPADLLLLPSIERTNFADWKSVQRWTSAKFQGPSNTISPLLAAKIAELRAKYSDKQQRAEAAITFVQDEIRYLGIEIGESGFRPHTAEQVLRQRFGDCKDKSLLLTLLLRALDVPAEVVLVASDGDIAPTDPPSPYRFDHAIVHLFGEGGAPQLQGWIDATVAHQGGGLARSIGPFAWALPIHDQDTSQEHVLGSGVSPGRDEQEGLIPVVPPLPTTPRVERTSRYVVSAEKPDAAHLTMTTLYRGNAADEMRAMIANSGRTYVQKEHLENLARQEPGISLPKGPEATIGVADDRRENVLTVTEQFAIENYLREGERDLYADLLASFTRAPHTTRRTFPLTVPRTYVRQVLIIEAPASIPLGGNDDSSVLSDDYFQARYTAVAKPQIFTATYDLTTENIPPFPRVVPANKVAAHLAARNKLGEALGLGIHPIAEESASEATPESVDEKRREKIALGLIWGLPLLGFIAAATFARLRKRKTRVVEERPGSTPARAIAVSEVAAAAQIFDARRCHGAPLTERESREITYENKDIRIEIGTCAHCGVRQRGYFRVP